VTPVAVGAVGFLQYRKPHLVVVRGVEAAHHSRGVVRKTIIRTLEPLDKTSSLRIDSLSGHRRDDGEKAVGVHRF